MRRSRWMATLCSTFALLLPLPVVVDMRLQSHLFKQWNARLPGGARLMDHHKADVWHDMLLCTNGCLSGRGDRHHVQARLAFEETA